MRQTSSLALFRALSRTSLGAASALFVGWIASGSGLVSAAEIAFDDFDSNANNWTASAGTTRVATSSGARGKALEWKYTLEDKAVFITTTAGMERLHGGEAFTIRVRSDRAGGLAIRMQQGGTSVFKSYFNKFEVGEDWKEIRLTKADIGHAFGMGKLNPKKVTSVFIVDLMGEEKGWRGERTVWIDSIEVEGEGVTAATTTAKAPSKATGTTAATATASTAATKAPQWAVAKAKSRPFRLGMTPWPYDYSPTAKAETYEILRDHSDLVAHHFGEGVPWPEAYANEPYHAKVREDVDYRAGKLKGTPVYLALTPMNFPRDDVAGYWAEDTGGKRPGKWKSKGFDDPEIITAYVNFCRTMIEKLKPSYFAYGIEVNMLAESNPKGFDKYVKMTAEVHKRLKAEFPKLPLLLSIHVETFIKDPSDQAKAIKRLVPYMDMMGVSSYPYGAKQLEPSKLPKDWFRQIADLAPGKRFAVAETGFIAQDFTSKKYRINLKGTETGQMEYVSWLLKEANALNAAFVVWFVPRDYDPFWDKLQKMGMDDVFKTWRDTGLVDENGRGRTALDVWDSWLKLPLRTKR